MSLESEDRGASEAATDAATALLNAGRDDEAWRILAARRADGEPDFLTLYLMAIILRRRGRPHEALAQFDAALVVKPDAADGHASRANLLNDLRRWPEALAASERALAIDPRQAIAANARGNALAGLGRGAEALDSYRAAAELAPGYADPLVNLANSELAQGSASAALASYARAIAASPTLAAAWSGRGHALSALNCWSEAVDAYDQAFALDPHQPFLVGQRLHARMKLCDWSTLDGDVVMLRAELRAGRPASVPFPLLALPLSLRDHRRAAELYAAAMLPAPVARTWPACDASRPIRLAYVSADFHDHATAYLIAEMLELHDRQRFDVIGLSLGPRVDDPMRRRLQAAVGRFFDASRLDDATVVELLRGLEVDIAVDLKGYTTGSRPAIFAARVAPIQVSYLGYPGTMGAPFIDYLVADPIVVPPSMWPEYSEKVAVLPDCYQVNDRRRARPEPSSRRSDHGLPATGFVFGCFNNNYKILPEAFAVWTRLLKAVPDSVLWLFEDNATAARNLRASAAAAGVDPARLVFATRAPLTAHLERHHHMDLCLDTWPCNAHTTASDALWMGTPLVTCLGETFAGRVAASLLSAAGLPDLITTTPADYEALSLSLARDGERLAAVRGRLAAGRTTSRLFDSAAFTRALEALYVAMQVHRAAGRPPDHLRLRASPRRAG